jgi:Protein of unknown function (DUF1761)
VDIHINYWAVLVAGVVYFVIGSFWYSPVLFGKVWGKLMGFDRLDKKAKEAMKKKMGQTFTFSFLAGLLTTYCLAFSVLSGAAFYHVNGAVLGLQSGFWIWLGFIATTQLNKVLFQGAPFKLYLIDVGYYLVGLLAAGTILAVWR